MFDTMVKELTARTRFFVEEMGEGHATEDRCNAHTQSPSMESPLRYCSKNCPRTTRHPGGPLDQLHLTILVDQLILPFP